MNNAPPIVLDRQDPCSPLAVSPSQTALLLLDFHTFIVHSQPDSGGPVLATAAALRSWAKTLGMPVLHCMIDLCACTSPTRKMAMRTNAVRDKMMGANPTAVASRGEPELIAATSDEYIFYRPPSHVSAMGSYGLEAFLTEHGIQSLVLAGFSTSGCVINTVKGAADKGFIVTVVEDACGDKDKDVHETIVRKLFLSQAHVIESVAYMNAWAKEVSALLGRIHRI